MRGDRFELHDTDVDALIGRVIRKANRARASYTQPADRDDVVQHLRLHAILLGEKYDPAEGLSFATYLMKFLPLRLVDWHRERIDTRYYELPMFVPVEEREEILPGYDDPYRASLERDAPTTHEEVLTDVKFHGR